MAALILSSIRVDNKSALWYRGKNHEIELFVWSAQSLKLEPILPCRSAADIKCEKKHT